MKSSLSLISLVFLASVISFPHKAQASLKLFGTSSAKTKTIYLADADVEAKGHFNRGLEYSKQGKIALAVNEYTKTIELDPDFVEAYYNRGTLYQDQGKFNLAKVDFDRAIELNPNFARAFHNRGILYISQGIFNLAEADFNQAIEINPNFTRAYISRGKIYRSQGNLDLAEVDYNRAIELNSDYEDVYVSRGILYLLQGQLNLAETDFTHAITINPNYAEAYYNRGALYINQGKLDLAEADLNRAIKLNSQSTTKDLGNSPDSSLQIDANEAKLYFHRGMVYQNQNKFDLAELDYVTAVQLNPNFAEAYANLGLSQINRGNITDATRNLEKAHQLLLLQGNSNLADKVANWLEIIEQETSQ